MNEKISLPVITPERSKYYLGQYDTESRPFLLGIRGYMHPEKGNEVGIYDDALFLFGPDLFMACNANTDPSSLYPGVATLAPGLWQYKLGIHGLQKPIQLQYTALVQAEPVMVQRFKGGLDTGFFGLNIHKGGTHTTGSMGCQTIYPTQWEGFIDAVKAALKKSGQEIIPYLLIDQGLAP